MPSFQFLDELTAQYTVGTSESTYTPAHEPDSVILINRGAADVHFAFDATPTTFSGAPTAASPIIPAQAIGGVSIAWKDGAESLHLITASGTSDVVVMAAREVRT